MSQRDTYYALCGLLALTVKLVLCDCPEDRKEQDHHEIRLTNDLLCAYISDARPVKDHKSAVNVTVRVGIQYISFDALEEIFTVHTWTALSWKDEYLKWTPADYGNIEITEIASYRIWTPRMALLNADASAYVTDGMYYTTCLVKYDGTVRCVPHVAHSGICQTTLQKWPYDVQNCTFFFGSWANFAEQVNYTFTSVEPIFRDVYEDGPGWKLLDVEKEKNSAKFGNNTQVLLQYKFVLKRISAGLAAIVVVPTVVITLLTLTSLLLDVKDDGRLILIGFSLYGHFNYLTEIGYQIPKHGADIPILLLFLRDSMILTVVGVIETLLLIHLKRRATPAPGWIVSLNRLVSSGPGKYVVFTEFETSDNSDDDKARTHIDWIQFANLLNSVLFIITVLVYFVLICIYIPRDN